jgi:hypothetical protein
MITGDDEMSISYADITDRMKLAGKLKNDSAIARVLDVTPQALSNYKKRGRMPMNLVLRFATLYSLSMDWLLTGKGETPKSLIAEGYPMTAEEIAPYGRDELARMSSLSNLNADEMIYVGKLLKILRSANKSAVTAMKCSVDAFLEAASALSEEDKAETEKGGPEARD